MTKFVITDEAVQEWLTNEFEGSPLAPTAAMARECALAVINEDREENELEPIVRCPKESAQTALSYIEDIAKEWNKELADEERDEEESDLDDEDSDEGKSLIKAKYKERYRPFRMSCGDEISRLISAHVTIEDEDGKHVDRDKLERFAKLNGIWNEAYRHLNAGQARMNVGNRARALVRKGGELVWN